MWTPSVSSHFLPGSLSPVLLNNDSAKYYTPGLCLQSPPHPFPNLAPNQLSSQLKCNLLSIRDPLTIYIFLIGFYHSQSVLPAESQSHFTLYVSSIRLRTGQFHFCVPIPNALHSVCHAEETQCWMNDLMKWWMMMCICFYFQVCKNHA